MLRPKIQDLLTNVKDYIGLTKQEVDSLKSEAETSLNEIKNIVFKLEYLKINSKKNKESSEEIDQNSELLAMQHQLTECLQLASNMLSDYHHLLNEYAGSLFKFKTTVHEKRGELALKQIECKKLKEMNNLIDEDIENQKNKHSELADNVTLILKELRFKHQKLSEIKYNLIDSLRKHSLLTSELRTIEYKAQSKKPENEQEDHIIRDLNKHALKLRQSLSPTRCASPTKEQNPSELFSIRKKEFSELENLKNQIRVEKFRLNRLAQANKQIKNKTLYSDLTLVLLFIVSLICTHVLININYK